MTDQHHPLTDDTIQYVKKLGIWTWIYTENDLRAAADWQLEQVMKWLDDYLEHFGDSDEYYQGNCESIFDLKDHLKKAMRPQEDN